MKEWKCIQLAHHEDVARTIEELQRESWILHSYQAAGMGSGPLSFQINHYLLFERGT